MLNAWDAYDRADVDAARALPLARRSGDAELELEALQLIAQIASERGDDNADVWATVEELAQRTGHWDSVAAAMRIRASFRLDDEPDAALPLVDAAADVCGAHGLVEADAWCDYSRAEAHFVAGRWDEALESGLRAIDLGESHDYHRVVVRSWFVVLPIARARGGTI